MATNRKLLGEFPFVTRTFEANFKSSPYVLDADANLFLGPADHALPFEHIAIAIIVHYLNQTGRKVQPLGQLLRDRQVLLEAFDVFDNVRIESESNEFQIFLFGSYDGDALSAIDDDELPCGPCGSSVNDVKRRFYALSARLDPEFHSRPLSNALRAVERRFVLPSTPKGTE